MRRYLGLIGSFIVAIIIVAQGTAAAQTVQRNRTLVIAQNFDPQSLWPNGTTASTNLNPGAVIVEPLFWIDPRTNKLEPVLAATADLDVTVLHYTTLAPFDRETLAKHASATVIVVEPFYTGTLAGEVSAALSAQPARIVSLGVPRQFLTNYGKLADHEQACGLDAAGLRERISTVLQ